MMPSLPIVGIGASAGGVEALEQFFKSVPAGNGLAFVVLTHLPPDRESLLSEILGRATRMPVVDARDGEKVEAEHVYVLPPSAILTIREGRLQLRRTGPADRERAPIDVFQLDGEPVPTDVRFFGLQLSIGLRPNKLACWLLGAARINQS